MKKIKFICSILFLAVVASGCTKIEGIDKDLSFLSSVGFTNPSKVFDISNDNSEITITMPSLTGLTLAGDGSINTKGQFIGTDNFVINASGSGTISMENGSANNLRVTISGSANVKTFAFPVQRAEVSVSGSGNAEINVAKTLNATISGSGNIYYKGAAESITTKITGSGKVVNSN